MCVVVKKRKLIINQVLKRFADEPSLYKHFYYLCVALRTLQFLDIETKRTASEQHTDTSPVSVTLAIY